MYNSFFSGFVNVLKSDRYPKYNFNFPFSCIVFSKYIVDFLKNLINCYKNSYVLPVTGVYP